MDALTIDGWAVPMAPDTTERITRAGGLSRTWGGNLRSGIRWEASNYAARTAMLTNAEAAELKRRTALGRVVTCGGVIIDPAGGTAKCRVLVGEGAFISTAADDGTFTMRSFTLEIHPVNEPLLAVYVPGMSLSEATFSRASDATYTKET